MGSLKGAHILLTGGTGFLGRHLLGALEATGAIVISVSRRLGYDLCNEAEMLKAVLLVRPSIIIHLATPTPGAPPASAYRDTVLMGMNVAHAAAIQNASQERVRLVMIGHPASYTTPAAHPEADEEAFWNGAPMTSSPAGAIGAAKKSLLQTCETYQAQYALDYSYLVPDPLYGPYESNSVVAKLVEAVMEAKAQKKKSSEIVLPFSETATWPLLYAADAAQAIVKACLQETIGGPINLPGVSPAPSTGEIAKIVCKALEYSGKIQWGQTAKNELVTTPPLKLGRAELEFGWSSSLTSLEAGVRGYIDWCWQSVRQPESATA